MKCTNCKKIIPDDSVFCPECGQKIIQQEPAKANTDVTNKDTSESISNGLKYGVFVGTLLIPLIGIVLGIVFLVDNNPIKKSVGKFWLWTGIIMGILNIVLILGS